MQKDRKKEHKQVIKYMKRWNKTLANDEYLGLNRFRLDLVYEDWERFSDNSGGILRLIFKITDTITMNVGFFCADNYDFKYDVPMHLNDFLIRCSSGHVGHIPQLYYVAYDVHKIVPYREEKEISIFDNENVINKWNYLNCLESRL